MSEYDFCVIGRWRNRENVANVVAAIRDADRSCFSFIENDWSHHTGWNFSSEGTEEMMQQLESQSMDNPEFKEIFDRDMNGLKNSEAVVLVFPAGTSSLIEAGVAYGLGKPVYAVASPNSEFKSESLFLIFDKIFQNLDEFKEFLEAKK